MLIPLAISLFQIFKAIIPGNENASSAHLFMLFQIQFSQPAGCNQFFFATSIYMVVDEVINLSFFKEKLTLTFPSEK